MSFVVARMQKLKADNLIGLGNHDQRKTANHSNQDIDVSRSHLNYDLVAGRTQNFKTDIQNYIDNRKASQRAVRKDAVLANEWVITSDKSFFEQLDEKQTRTYFETAKQYFADKFGDENIRYAIVHLDESTPHMHMGIVPFDDDNKLSAKRVFNRETLQKIQDELPEFLQEKGFKIERGQKSSERKNLTVPEYKKMQDNLTENKQELETVKSDTKKWRQELDQYQFHDENDAKIDRKPALFKKGYSVVQDVSLEILERDASQGQLAHNLYVSFQEDNEKLRSENKHLRDVNDDLTEKNSKLAKALANAQDLIKRMTKILKEKLGDRLHISAKVWRGAGLKASENPTKPPKQKPERDTGLKR